MVYCLPCVSVYFSFVKIRFYDFNICRRYDVIVWMVCEFGVCVASSRSRPIKPRINKWTKAVDPIAKVITRINKRLYYGCVFFACFGVSINVKVARQYKARFFFKRGEKFRSLGGANCKAVEFQMRIKYGDCFIVDSNISALVVSCILLTLG